MKNFLLNLFLLFFIAGISAAGFFYYKHTHAPKIANIIIPRKEIDITIIPGWNLRDIADDWVKKGIVSSTEDVYVLLGKPAYNYKAHGETAPVLALANNPEWAELFADKPNNVSYEGYLMPDTYRVYADATPEDVLKKIFTNLNDKITSEMRAEIKKKNKTFYEILTMASVVQKEAPTKEEMAMVADIFWRRYDKNWALQSCATVNYITGKNDPGVSSGDKDINSLFNTYKYPGLPLGAISNPGRGAIEATINPQNNSYWYFMSDADGVTHWARTLDEHNYNVAKYLR
ncbi:MAG: endolytic transglycosylase MltG [Patescibacteria group bacterium]